ncbi:hypothetical protein HMPREF1141_1727 [Clostridium sp. MSTE9]|nr:hypothetical protein HMPREF1141_1727 [Clostridium sp. MSTE9]
MSQLIHAKSFLPETKFVLRTLGGKPKTRQNNNNKAFRESILSPFQRNVKLQLLHKFRKAVFSVKYLHIKA